MFTTPPRYDLLRGEGVDFEDRRTALDARRIVGFAAKLHDFGGVEQGVESAAVGSYFN